jgi:Ca2+-binding RTX toxin-like protein
MLLCLAPFRVADAATRRGVASVHGERLRYRGPTTRGALLRIRADIAGDAIFRDSGGVLAGAGCTSLSSRAARCPGLGADVVLGGFGDYLAARGIALNVDSRAGVDLIRGGSGNDTVFSGFGDDLLFGRGASDSLFGMAGMDAVSGGSGNDTLVGGMGADRVIGGGGDDLLGEPAGFSGARDFLKGGIGADTVDFGYLGSAEGVTVSLDGLANDGPPGAKDNVAGDIETVVGTRFDDTLEGNGHANDLVGGDGADVLVGGAGHDTLLGDHGNDHIDARDGSRDRVICGTGPADVADVDAEDSVTPSCEIVNLAP